MAVGCIAQASRSAGTWAVTAVIVYSLVGAVLARPVRPVEECDLGERFRDDYFNYGEDHSPLGCRQFP